MNANEILESSDSTAVDYYEAGFRVIPLHPVLFDENGKAVCGCGNPQCESAGKHPVHKAWQQSPHWSIDQFANMIESGQLEQFGVILDNHLVVDIDPRNGGFESYDKLCAQLGIDLKQESQFVVSTGGGGFHIYFDKPSGLALKQSAEGLAGIDFKSSGFVVGYGCNHASGMLYERSKGFATDSAPIPSALLSILEKKMNRGVVDGGYVDVDDNQLFRLLKHIDGGDSYERWLLVGMALHHTSSGAKNGLIIWDEWSQRFSNYQEGACDQKWHSFGKGSGATPITLGSIYHLARANGYVDSFSFELTPEQLESITKDEVKAEKIDEDDDHKPINPIDISCIDIRRPSGFIGELAKFFRDSNRRQRDLLCAAQSLSVVGNVAGLRYTDRYGARTNSLWMCVADSGTGKDAIQGNAIEIYQSLKIGRCYAGNIKSEQELYRAIRSQQALFVDKDEIGQFLEKIGNNKDTHFLAGIPYTIMTLYSRTDKHYAGSFDFKIETVAYCEKAIKDSKKNIEGIDKIEKRDNESEPDFERRKLMLKKSYEINIDRMNEMKASAETGLYEPFFSMMGYTTSVGFDDFFIESKVKDGLLGRMIIARESDSAPPFNPDYKSGRKLPLNVMAALQSLVEPLGVFEPYASNYRIQYHGERVVIQDTEEAENLLKLASDYWYQMSQWAKSNDGYEALYNRAFENVLKISLIMAIPEGVRTEYHVRYAMAMTVRDIKEKLLMVAKTNGIKVMPENAFEIENELNARILTTCEDWTQLSVAINRAKNKRYMKEVVESQIKKLVKSGELLEKIEKHPRNGKEFRKIMRNNC